MYLYMCIYYMFVRLCINSYLLYLFVNYLYCNTHAFMNLILHKKLRQKKTLLQAVSYTK